MNALRAGRPIPSERISKLGVPNDWASTPAPELDNAFGPGFATALARLQQGQWSGPIHSGYGWHLVKLVHRDSESMPPFEQVKKQVAQEYTYRNQLSTQERMYHELLRGYTVELPVTGLPATTRVSLGAR